jgi:hypothetical protein
MSTEVLYSLTEISRALNIEPRRLAKLAKGIAPVGFRGNGKKLFKIEQFDAIRASEPAKLVSLTLTR